jgi:uncharacterized surface protein with fasciclin (FAS1) repeats
MNYEFGYVSIINNDGKQICYDIIRNKLYELDNGRFRELDKSEVEILKQNGVIHTIDDVIRMVNIMDD